MRTLIIFPMLIFIGFGFLLSDNFNTRQDMAQVQKQTNRLMEENKQLRNEITVTLNRLSESDRKVAELTKQNNELAENVRKSNEENGNLQSQIYSLQTKIQLLQKVSSIWDASSKIIRLAIFLPILPGSMMVTYVLVRNKNKLQRKQMNGQHTAWVHLTDHEIQEIIHMRRQR